MAHDRTDATQADRRPPAPVIESPPELLRQAAETLTCSASEITDRWVDCLEATLYAGRPDLALEDIRAHPPVLVQGVAEALQRGEPQALTAPWTGSVREHAEQRRRRGVPLGDLIREFQMLRAEIWATFSRRLESAPASSVFGLAQALDAAVDTMVAIAVSTYGGELQATISRLEAIQRVSDAGIVNLPLEQMLNELLQRIREALSGDTARLLLLTDNGRRLVLHASQGLRAAPGEEVPIPLGEGIAGHVAQARRPVVIDDLSTVEVVSPLLRRSIRSLVTVPLEVEGRIIGVVDVGTTHRRHFTPDDVQLLQTVASRAATAIERKRAEEERDRLLALERIKTQELEGLRRVTDPALARQGLQELIHSLLARTLAIMGADTGALMLLDPAAQELVLRATAGIPSEQIIGPRVPLGTNFVERVATQTQVLWVQDVQTDPAFSSPTIRASHIRAMMGAPLRAREELIGVIFLGFLSAKEFGSYEEHLLAVVAERAAQAIHEAQLLEHEREARLQAEEAVRARDRFLETAAHELKTPITSLRGYSQTIIRRLERAEGLDPEQGRRALRVIDMQSDRLARLVQQLLDVATIESGQLELHREQTDLTLLVRHLLERLQVGIKRHTLTMQAPPSVPAFVDPARIEQVVGNLLDNAIKFTPYGTPIEVELGTPEPGTVKLCVRDHGPGIPPEQRERLFGRFFQAQAGRPFAGLGLGLYYSRHIVEMHGGRIWVESEVGVGSAFCFTLPTEG